MTWEYSEADTEFGALQAKELKSHLSDVLSQFAVEITEGVDFIEGGFIYRYILCESC